MRCCQRHAARLKHLLDQKVDLGALLSARSTLIVVVQNLTSESASGRGQLNGPQEVGHSLEVGANSVDFVDDILNGLDALVSQSSLDDRVVTNGQSLARHLAKASLVDNILNRLQAGVSVGDEGLDQSQHLGGGGVNTNENTVVQLSQSQQLQDLLHLGRHTNNTAHTHNEHKLLLSGDKNLVVGLSISSVGNSFLGKLIG